MAFRLDVHATRSYLASEQGDVGRFLARAANDISTLAKQLCPVDTGRLRSSIAWEFRHDGDVYVVVGTNVEYAIYVHEGTRYMAGTPFLTTALHAIVG